MPMEISTFGDWKKLYQALKNFPEAKLNKALERSATKSALLLTREMKLGIRNQAPGGQPFKPLSEITIQKKGSSKALIDTGFLMASITQRIVGTTAFVGLLRTTVNEDGTELVNIAAVHEFGATVRTKNGKTIIIPARPFVGPTLEANKDKVEGIYREELVGLFK